MADANQTDDNISSIPGTPGRKPIRWWPAFVILFLAFVVIVGVRLWPKTSFQEKNITTAQVVIVSLGLTLLWVLFFSRLRWFTRLIVFAGVVGVIVLMAGLFKIR